MSEKCICGHDAILKILLNWVESTSNLRGKDLVKALKEGCTNTTYLGLVEEYEKRSTLLTSR